MKGLNLLTCSKGQGRVKLHDCMVWLWHSMVLAAGLTAFVEEGSIRDDPILLCLISERGRSSTLTS